jgi:hypothetical protein
MRNLVQFRVGMFIEPIPTGIAITRESAYRATVDARPLARWRVWLQHGHDESDYRMTLLKRIWCVLNGGHWMAAWHGNAHRVFGQYQCVACGFTTHGFEVITVRE